MKVEAKLKYLRISPRKVRLVADLIRRKRVSEAQTLLEFTIKRATKPLKKLLESAISNARNNFGLKESNLLISEIFIDEGPTLKRVRPRAFGKFFPIHKRTSHVTLILDEIERSEEKKARKEEEKKSSLAKVKAGKEERKKRGLRKPRKRFQIKKEFRPGVRERARKTFRRKSF